MKKLSPFLYPLVAVAVIFFLVYRWYATSTQRVPDLGLTEGVQIENLTDEEIVSAMQGTDDLETVELESSQNVDGQIRYEVKDNAVSFSVIANLPQGDTPYHVWMKSSESETFEKVFSLQPVKGGYIGSASVDTQLLPIEVIVSSSEDSNSLEDTAILKGVLEEGEQN